MWRKIHSNRDPRDTLLSELQKEFKPWFSNAKNYTKAALGSYPKFFFGCMITLLLVSFTLSFTVFRHREKPKVVATKPRPDPVGDGFSQIMKATVHLRETLKLKHTVDSLTSKKQLSATDSLLLDSALNRLQHIQTH
ncbi:MAG: hypothetical protein V4577_08330 [Bacteroidota bacterium]